MQHNYPFKKIGLIAPYFLPVIGGANIYCYELAKAYAEKGFEVHVFSVEGALNDDSYILHPILTHDLKKDLALLNNFDMDLWHSLFLYYAPLSFHKKNVFVTTHGDDIFSFSIRYNLPGKKLLDQHLLWRLPDSVKNRLNFYWEHTELLFNKIIFSFALKKAKQVITVSQFTRTMFAQKFPSASSNVSVVPPGVSENFFAEHNVKKDTHLFLTVSRIDEHDRIKNIHNVIKAFALLKDRFHFKYVIISGNNTGNYKDELDSLIKLNRLEDRVFIEGRKTLDELLEYYRKAGLFILVSYAEPKNFEGFGIVFLEANACGTPVLTSKQGGMSDYVKEGENGFYVNDVDAYGIKDALERYLTHQIEFDDSTIKQSPAAYKWSNIANRILEIYRNKIQIDS
ncbi:glycosyltransferase family 4 protein [Methylomonas sp. SURF-1]|uniref:Glycosyltransferase family 4 protein n=1 Tax=Methylomonas aurea TaxID=2952224 RepID=A0ABT1UE59_9GAMM|nr:glycosyltransferase family 4 protein [Methylomonas sp. SURF-1]MCQ8179975.1 glycosyltransferase family 4 protein [Methylomonas sp. SURF-1]